MDGEAAFKHCLAACEARRIRLFRLVRADIPFSLFQHLSHHLLHILPHIHQKAQLSLDFFNKLREAASSGFPLF